VTLISNQAAPPGVNAARAVRKIVAGTNPAANTEVSETVPAGKTWHLKAVSVALVQGITNTPQPILVIDDGTAAGVVAEIHGATTAQAVSTTCRYTWAAGLTLTGLVGATTDVHAHAPLPEDLILRPGYRIRTNTIGKAGTSDYGVPTLTVVEYS
jgi:hypothetical protein